MEIHLLGLTQTCTCEARHVCQSCQGQDERLRAVNAQLLEALERLMPLGDVHQKDGWAGDFDKAAAVIKEARK